MCIRDRDNRDKEVWLDVDVKSEVKSVEMLNKNIPDADMSLSLIHISEPTRPY